MKESEAKEKVCPFMYNQGEVTNCICGDCMAWVYTNTHEERMKPCTGEYQTEIEIMNQWKKQGFKSNDKQGGDFRLTRELKDKEGYCIRLGAE